MGCWSSAVWQQVLSLQQPLEPTIHPPTHPPPLVINQITELKRGTEIVVCTPGRMIDILGELCGSWFQLFIRVRWTGWGGW